MRPLDALIDGIYEAALDPERWPSILGEIREGVGASAYILFTVAANGNQPPELLTFNIDPEWSRAYREHWWQHDDWVAGAVQRGFDTPGLTLSGSMLVESTSFQKGAWFNEALKQQDIGDLLTTTLWNPDVPSPQLVLSFYRSPRAERFGTEEMMHLQILSSHLRRALNLSLDGAKRAQDLKQQTAILDEISQPLLILDGQRKITSLNKAAEQLLSHSGSGVLHIRANRILEIGQRSTPTFESAFEKARLNSSGPVPIAFVLPGNNEAKITGSARLMKLRQPPSLNFRLEDNDRYMLQIDLTEIPPPESLRAFADLFGLTQAEFRVLTLLIEDSSPRLIADLLGITLPTVRTHLQRIRQKTGTKRFADLVRLTLSASKGH